MAYATATRTAPMSAIATLRVVNFFQGMLEDIAAWSEARATRRALMKLTDDQLKDIGLERVEIF